MRKNRHRLAPLLGPMMSWVGLVGLATAALVGAGLSPAEEQSGSQKPRRPGYLTLNQALADVRDEPGTNFLMDITELQPHRDEYMPLNISIYARSGARFLEVLRHLDARFWLQSDVEGLMLIRRNAPEDQIKQELRQLAEEIEQFLANRERVEPLWRDFPDEMSNLSGWRTSIRQAEQPLPDPYSAEGTVKVTLKETTWRFSANLRYPDGRGLQIMDSVDLPRPEVP